jgi:hypothetical protein
VLYGCMCPKCPPMSTHAPLWHDLLSHRMICGIIGSAIQNGQKADPYKKGTFVPFWRKGASRTLWADSLGFWNNWVHLHPNGYQTDYLLLWYDSCLPARGETKMAIWNRNRTSQPTATKSGRRWATTTLVVCGLFTIWAQYDWSFVPDFAVPIIVAVFPPIVSFVSSHLISYLNPKTKWTKTFVYGGFGAVIASAMTGSALHILRTVHDAGQPWHTAWTYVFMADAPMLLAASVLAIKVTGTATKTNRTTETKSAETETVVAAPKKVTPTKTTKPAARKTTPAKSTKPSQTVPTPSIPTFSTPLDDPSEKELLRDGASR